jgi:secreted PhoX family phosphatase
MEITGPAAGHDRMKTKADPAGTRVLGMINNCAGGMTPWGTWLSAEENFNGYFWGKLATTIPRPGTTSASACPGNQYNWGAYHDRFDIAKEPNEGNRFGWIVEIDPFDPTSTPKKRTALGRFKHEGATTIVNKDGRVVAYTGDDERFDYVYRFVTAGRFDPANRAANMGLLDEGTLSAARYNPDGSLEWLPLVHGRGPADGRERLQQPGRRADRDPPGGRPGGRHQDGPAGGHRAEREDRQGLPDAHQQHAPQGGPGGRRQPAARQRRSATSSR